MRKEAKSWLDKAEEDFSTAQDCLTSKHFDASAFHAQQAAEKALKALQIQTHGRFDKMHDLVSLEAVNSPNDIIVLHHTDPILRGNKISRRGRTYIRGYC